MVQVVEGRLFSKGLHVLGQAPTQDNLRSYLAAYFGDRLPDAALDEVASGSGDAGEVEALRDRLERSFRQVRGSLQFCKVAAEANAGLHLAVVQGQEPAGMARKVSMPVLEASPVLGPL